MESPLISVVVPVYNTEKYIAKCIDSIMNQTYPNLEIIIVDDGSTDKSGCIADSISKTDSRIKVIHKTNGGLSSARNCGIDQAKGTYIGFVDSDDWIEKDMYLKLYEAISFFQCKMAVCGRYDIYENRGLKKIGLCPHGYKKITGEECVGKILIWGGMDSSACDKLFETSLFTEFKFPEGKISEDVAIMYQVALKSREIALVPYCLYNYNHRDESITTTTVFKPDKLHIVDHSKTILEYVSIYHPKIIENAIFFRCFILVHAYNLIVNSNKYKEDIYKKKIYEFSDEIKRNWKIYIKYDKGRKNLIHVIKLKIMLCPQLFLFINQVISKINIKRKYYGR